MSGRSAPFSLSGRLADTLAVSGILTFWWFFVGPIVLVDGLQGTDVYRDAATAINMQQGHFFADPSYAGEELWYPPLSPLIAAGLSTVLQVEPLDCYRWSQLLLNWLIPAGLYFLIVPAWGRRAALCAVVAVLFAMPWWQSEVAHGQPSIHAVILAWASLAMYARQEMGRSMAWAIAYGAWQGISFWHHPFAPTVLVVATCVQAAWSMRHSQSSLPQRRAVWRRHLASLGVTLMLAAPILFLMLRGPVLNATPREYIAEELATVEFAALHGSPLLWGLGAIGLYAACRRAAFADRLLICCLVVTAVAQLPGYVRLYGGPWTQLVPVLVPHEFQRLFQLGWAALIGVGASLCMDAALPRVRLRPWTGVARAGMAAAICAAVAGHWLMETPQRLRAYLRPLELSGDLLAAGDWVREHTDINDSFVCDHDLAFEWLGVSTGRKAWLVPPGHSNPRIDWVARKLMLDAMAEETSPQRLWSTLVANGIQYVVSADPWTPAVFQSADTGWRHYFDLVHPPSQPAPNALAIYAVRATWSRDH